MGEHQEPQLGARRPIAARSSGWAQAWAARCVRWGWSANGISLASIAFAAIAAAAWVTWPMVDGLWQRGLLLAAAVAVVLRLLCNLFDGMVAIEGGRRTPSGPIFNEVPDRISDSLVLIAMGYGISHVPWAVDLAWAAALTAMATAYVRALGASLGCDGCFHGPMAKQQRMAIAILLALIGVVVPGASFYPLLIWGGLAVITVGAAATTLRRLLIIARHLRQQEVSR